MNSLMCCSNMQRHAWTIVSTPIYKCFATGHNKLASSFKYFKIIFLHVFTTCYSRSYNKAISLLHIKYYFPAVCLQCRDSWLEVWGLNRPCTSSPVEERPYLWVSVPELSDKDKRHPASDTCHSFSYFGFTRRPVCFYDPISILTCIIFALF